MKTLAFFSLDDTYLTLCIAQAAPRRLISSDAVGIGTLNDEQITGRLRELVKQHRLNLAQTKVVAVIPRAHVLMRSLNLPSQRQEELKAMIDLQIVNHVPYAREEIEIDFHVLSQSADGYSQVLVVIVPHEIALRYWNIFTRAGLNVAQITISSVGLWMLYRQQQNLDGGVTAVIDMRASQTEICLCTKQHWNQARVMPIGLQDIKSKGWDDFKKQWQATLDVKERGTRIRVSQARILTLNGEAEILAAELAVAIDVPVKLIEIKNMAAVSLAPLLGLALGQDAIGIDLVPQNVRREKMDKVRKKEMTALGSWGVGAVAVFMLALGMGHFQKKSQLDHLQAQVKEASRQAAKVEARWQYIKAIQAKANNRVIVAKIIEVLYQALPQGVSLVNLTLTSDNILSFQGVTAQPNEISQIQSRMMAADLFANVNLDYVNKRVTQEGEINYFKLTARLKQQKANDETFK